MPTQDRPEPDEDAAAEAELAQWARMAKRARLRWAKEDDQSEGQADLPVPFPPGWMAPKRG